MLPESRHKDLSNEIAPSYHPALTYRIDLPAITASRMARSTAATSGTLLVGFNETTREMFIPRKSKSMFPVLP